jgi:DNA-binding protein H-NS
MAAINVDKMSLKELVALEAKVQGAIAEARTKGRAEAKSKVAELAASHGFSISELFGGNGRVGTSKATGIAKYANPDDAADTWTGR